jgi:hypothetical protein
VITRARSKFRNEHFIYRTVPRGTRREEEIYEYSARQKEKS